MARDLRLNGANQPGPPEEATELPATNRIYAADGDESRERERALIAREILIEKAEKQLNYDQPRDACKHRRKRREQSEAAFQTPREKSHLRKGKNRKNDQQPTQGPSNHLENADYRSLQYKYHIRLPANYQSSYSNVISIAVIEITQQYY